VEVLGGSEVGTLRKYLGSLFESLVHLLEPTQRVGVQAPRQQANEHPLERFVLHEPNEVLSQRVDGKGVLPVEDPRNKQVADLPHQAVGLGA
jgi:hypothetical protein